MAALAVVGIVAARPADARGSIGAPPPFIVTGPYYHDHWRHNHWRRVVWRHKYCRSWKCRWD
jgi:hypothetical protein